MIRRISENKQQVADICRTRRVSRLGLFGSATGAGFQPAASDLDFVVEFEPMPPVQHAECYFGLLEDLERLFGRSVDLVEAGPIRNPYFREAVERTQVPIYEAA